MQTTLAQMVNRQLTWIWPWSNIAKTLEVALWARFFVVFPFVFREDIFAAVEIWGDLPEKKREDKHEDDWPNRITTHNGIKPAHLEAQEGPYQLISNNSSFFTFWK